MNYKLISRLFGLMVLFLYIFPSPSGALEWETIGPFGGDQFMVGMAPDKPETLFALAHFGLHRSDDGGLTWKPVHTAEMSKGTFLDLAFDPLDPDRLFVANNRTGVWRSRDKGMTWEKCGAGLPEVEDAPGLLFPVSSLAFGSDGGLYAGLAEIPGKDAQPPAWIYRNAGDCGQWSANDSGITITVSAAERSQDIAVLLNKDRDGGLWAMVYGGGVFQLKDGLWEARNGNLPPAALRATFLEPDPADARRFFLGTESEWLYETTDYGAGWWRVPRPDALAGLSVLPLTYTIRIDPRNLQVIYVDTNDANGSIEQPLFKPSAAQTAGGSGYVSVDGGSSWLEYPRQAFRLTVDSRDTVSGYVPPAGMVQRSSTWYMASAGLGSLQKSEDGLKSFKIITDGLDNFLVNTIYLHDSSGRETVLLAASEEGIFRYDIDGWTHQKPVTDHLYTWSIAADPADSRAILYATGHPAWSYTGQMGVYRAGLDCFGACSPEQLLAGTGTWRVITTPLLPDTIYAATQDDGVMVSHDRGATWSSFNAGLELPKSITDLILDNNGAPLFAATRSSDGDTTAEPPQAWIASTDETGGVYRFDQETETWLATGGLDAAVLDLESDPGDPGTLFAATAHGIYKTNDSGDSWQGVLPNLVVNDILFDPDRPQYIYAATNGGVYRSTNGGGQWYNLADGLLVSSIYSLALDRETGVLYAGTGGNSVARLMPDPDPQPVLVVSPESIDFGTVPVGFGVDAAAAVTNEGEGDLVISALESDHSAFAPVDFSPPLVVPPRVRQDLSLRFAPAVPGSLAGVVRISSNDQAAPVLSLAVKGEGREPVYPQPEVDIPGMTGGNVPFGETIELELNVIPGDYLGRTADFWVRLTLADSSTLWYVKDSGWLPSASPMMFSKTAIADLGEPILISLPALISGAAEVLFAVDDNDDGRFDATWSDTVSFTVDLSPPALMVLPDELSFGEVAVGIGKTASLTMANNGEERLLVTGLSVEGEGFKFQTEPTLPLSLPAQSHIGVAVSFVPQTTGVKNGELVIVSNDHDNPSRSVALTGSAREATLPMPVIKANGVSDRLDVSAGTLVNITVENEAGDYAGRPVEWWLGAETPVNTYWFSESGWQPSDVPLLRAAAPMGDVSPPLLILSMTLAPGDYLFTVNIDETLNASDDRQWYAEVAVHVE